MKGEPCLLQATGGVKDYDYILTKKCYNDKSFKTKLFINDIVITDIV